MSEAEWELALRACTPRQLQVLAWHRRGYGYRAIGRVLGLAPGTVRDRVKRARERMLDVAERDAA